jgi:cytochrome c-type biogenesis protein CcmF
MGILLGSRWAYEELGWGGYWAWDPVENAAFIPWLVATAFLHSVMVQERRGMLRVWNMSLVILTFTLAVFGTFLTRSGIVASVHAFGESTLGAWFLGFIAIILAGSTALLIVRLPMLRSRHALESFVSREAIFLYNNLLLLGLAFAVLWGTIFPILSEAFRGREITVGQGYFDQIAVPIGIALIVLTGVGPLVPWRKASLRRLAPRVVPPVAVGALVGLGMLVLTDAWESPAAAGTISAAAFVVACVVGELWRAARTRHALGDVSWVGATTQPVMRNRRRYGGYLVHIGVAVLFVGLAASSSYANQADFALNPGDRGEVAGYTFVYENASRARDEHVGSVGVVLGVFDGGERIGTMSPGVNFYFDQEQRSTEVAIDSGPTRDLYVVLAGLDESGTARLSVFVNPMVSWLWAAGIIMFAGGLFAVWPAGAARRPEPVAEDPRVGARAGGG